jgi:hypothetical protein
VLCALDGTDCQPELTSAAQVASRIDGISVPSTGEWALRAWLEDAAGNVDRSHFAETTLRYGSAPSVDPPAATSDGTNDSTTDASRPSGTESAELTLAPISEPFVPIGVSTSTSGRRDPRLRLTSARAAHGRIVVRGQLVRGTRRQLSLTLRLTGGRLIRRSVHVRGGRFSVSLPIPPRTTLRGSVRAQLADDSAFLPARATLRLTR